MILGEPAHTPWRRQLIAAGVAAALTAYAPPAAASFDIVGVYHDRVKNFETVWYLEEDDVWRRDRRVIEVFGETDILQSAEEDTELQWAGASGLLLNIRPYDDSSAQLSFFSILNVASFGQRGTVTESLHGGRLTLGEWVEVSAGAYWLEDSLRNEGALFLELNCPAVFGKSSYVIGKDLRGGLALERFDFRIPYDQFSFADNVEVGVARYAFFGRENWMVMAGVTRLGHPAFRFFTAEAKFSISDLSFAYAQGGFDYVHQFEQDFNLTRRGHFGTSIGIRALYRYTTPSGVHIFSPKASQRLEPTHGFEGTLHLQIPAKWFLTALVVFGKAYQSTQTSDAYLRQQHIQEAAEFVTQVAEEPRDIVFCRITFTYSFNDPRSYDIQNDAFERHRFLTTLSFIY